MNEYSMPSAVAEVISVPCETGSRNTWKRLLENAQK